MTVDDIAERVGISRRTFFNHVESKESAVLGSLPRISDELIAVLEEGRSETEEDLLELTVTAAASAMHADATDIEDWRRLHDAITASPELLARLRDRIVLLNERIVSHLASRCDMSDERARVVLGAAGIVLQLSIEDALDRPGLGTFPDRLQTNLALLRELAGHART